MYLGDTRPISFTNHVIQGGEGLEKLSGTTIEAPTKLE